MDWIRENITTVILVVVGVLVVPVLIRKIFSGGRRGGGPVRVYCNHCNWEGKATRRDWICKKCKSTDLHVIST